MIKAGIIGATGYAGNELARLLLGHKEVEVAWYGSRSYIDQKYADVYQNFFKLIDAKCMDDNMAALADEVDVIFTATPQGLCASLVNEEILSKAKVIDLSADFRIKDVKKYEKWYGIEHKAPQFIDEAVYGLCEINREGIKKARLIANQTTGTNKVLLDKTFFIETTSFGLPKLILICSNFKSGFASLVYFTNTFLASSSLFLLTK